MSSFLCCCCASFSSVEKYNPNKQTESQSVQQCIALPQTDYKQTQIVTESLARKEIQRHQVTHEGNFLAPPPIPQYMWEKSTVSRSNAAEQNELPEHKSTSSQSSSQIEISEVLISQIDQYVSSLKTKQIKQLRLIGNPCLSQEAANFLKVTEFVNLEHLEIIDCSGFFSGQFFNQKLNMKATQLIFSLYQKMAKLQTIYLTGRSIIKRSPSLERITLNPIKSEILITRK